MIQWSRTKQVIFLDGRTEVIQFIKFDFVTGGPEIKIAIPIELGFVYRSLLLSLLVIVSSYKYSRKIK